MLCDAEFSPALDAIDQIILFLLALINSIVNLLFGKTTRNDSVQRPAVEQKPSQQIKNSLKMTP